MSDELEQIAEIVTEASGIELRAERLGSLRTAIARVAPGADVTDLLRELADPDTGAELRGRLSEAVAVHETFFFRHRDDLETIDWLGLLSGARALGSDRVRVWVAGCSTGEEAYTLVLLAGRALAAPEPPVSILATDLSSAALRRAEAGVYEQRSMRYVDEDLRTLHFTSDGRRHRVADHLRRHVSFQQHNLVTEPPPGRFDLILCRNVLIYFRPATVERVVDRLESALAPGGTLLLGAADRLCRPQPPARLSPAPPVRSRPRARPRAADSSGRRVARPVADGPSAAPPDSRERLASAMVDADAGRLDEAIEATEALLRADPLDADAHFVHGLAELQRGDATAAVEALRRAVYVDPGFALATFKLGRAYDAVGDRGAAARAYRQTLQTLAPGHDRQRRLAPEIDLADIAAACSARLAALSSR